MKTSLLLVVPVLAALAATPAFAQISRPERPYRGLFGGGGGSGEYEQSLTASLSLGGGYDGNVLTGAGDYAPSDPTTGKGSTYAQLSGGLSYSLGRDRASFSASVSGGTSYFTTLQTQIANAFGTSVGGSFKFSERSQVAVSYSAWYSPNYALGGFSPFQPPPVGQPPVTIGDTLGARVEDHITQTGSIGFTQGFTSRLSLTASYDVNRSDSPSGEFDLWTRIAKASLSYAIGKGLSARLGYSRTSNESGPADNRQRYEGDGLDGGLDFSRALSLSRRTTLAFTTGFTTTRNADDVRYDAVGSAVLSYELARTWTSSLNYSRTVQFSDVLGQPVFSDTVSVGVSGLLNRRIQVHVAGGGSRGDVGFAETGNAFWNYYATAGTGLALNQFVSFNLSYTYYRYRYQDAVVLPAGLPNFAQREGVMAYVSLWAPIMQSGRRPNASR